MNQKSYSSGTTGRMDHDAMGDRTIPGGGGGIRAEMENNTECDNVSSSAERHFDVHVQLALRFIGALAP
jgi:hypothetical protein